jgi:hypothetical protein
MTDDVPEHSGPPGLSGARPACEASLCKLKMLVLLIMGSVGMVRNERCRPPVLQSVHLKALRLPNPGRRPRRARINRLCYCTSWNHIQLSGSGSKGSEGKGVMGKVVWYHEEWQPVDAARYGDSVCKESLRVLSAERAQMSCKHCKRSFHFNPSTRFRNHLLFDCDGFGTTDTYQSGPVQVDSNEEKQKVAHKTKVRTMQESCWRTHVHVCHLVLEFNHELMVVSSI